MGTSRPLTADPDRRHTVIPATSDEDGRLAHLVACAAELLSTNEPAIAAGIVEHLAAIPGMAPDHQMHDFMARSTEANLSTIFHLVRRRIAPENVPLPRAASAYVEMLAQRGTGAHVLIRAYHRGQDLLKEHFFTVVEDLDADAEEKLRVVHELTDVVYRWVDQMTQNVLEIHEAEHHRWASATGDVTTTMVRGLLAGERTAPDFEQATGYRLARRHVALVCWIEGDQYRGDRVGDLERLAHELVSLQPSRGRRALFTPVDASTAWLWLPLGDEHPSLPQAQLDAVVDRIPHCRAAVGLAGVGVLGFRRSHEQAVATHELALVGESAGRVVSYGDAGVALVSMLSRDLDSLRGWVRDTLGGLAVDDDATAVLRDTLWTFLDSGCSQSATAEKLILHRNTIRYRLERAVELRRRGLDDDRPDLSTALQCARLLGARVLVPAS